jgi:branched-chain amino acid transport system ATP-binding protein
MNQSIIKDQNGNRSIILSGEGLTKRFGGVTALTTLDFHVFENEILGVIGPNGAGKTTLFHVIAGVFKADAGSIKFANQSMQGLRPDLICRKGIARTFQITKPFLQMSVLENVMLGAYFGVARKHHLKTCQKNAEKILALIGLTEKRKALASQLTLVERKRLELARALSTEPRVLLLDEVIGGLNPTETLETLDIIRGINERGITILMIEHVMKAIMDLSHRIIVLNYGKKIAEGSPKEITSTKSVIDAYLGGLKDVDSE